VAQTAPPPLMNPDTLMTTVFAGDWTVTAFAAAELLGDGCCSRTTPVNPARPGDPQRLTAG
jgi:hypothetical protein